MSKLIVERKNFVTNEKETLFSLENFRSATRWFLLSETVKKTLYPQRIQEFVEHLEKRGLDADEEKRFDVNEVIKLFKNILDTTNFAQNEVIAIDLH